jgi:hypothetical protein
VVWKVPCAVIRVTAKHGIRDLRSIADRSRTTASRPIYPDKD